MNTFAKMGLATLAFAVLHSTLAASATKQVAARVVGERRRDATYRLFFVGQSLVTFGLLIRFGARLPVHTLYRIEGKSALLMRAGQIAGVLHLVAAARRAGIGRLIGLENFRAWRSGKPIPAGPYAQGPEILPDGRLSTDGPYRWSRHPLNFSGIPLFWLTPRMTTRRLAFNIASTVYFVLGSIHEEIRLRHGYGDAYLAYRDGPVPFYWPRLFPRLPAS